MHQQNQDYVMFIWKRKTEIKVKVNKLKDENIATELAEKFESNRRERNSERRIY